MIASSRRWTWAAGGSFDQILERFELYLNAKAGAERVQRGLGYNNLLFMRPSSCCFSRTPTRSRSC